MKKHDLTDLRRQVEPVIEAREPHEQALGGAGAQRGGGYRRTASPARELGDAGGCQACAARESKL